MSSLLHSFFFLSFGADYIHLPSDIKQQKTQYRHLQSRSSSEYNKDEEHRRTCSVSRGEKLTRPVHQKYLICLNMKHGKGSTSAGALWIQLNPVISTKVEENHTHVHRDLRKQWERVKHSDRNADIKHGTDVEHSGGICTQTEQKKENNLERRGRGGGCAAPCSSEVYPTTSTPSQQHHNVKETLGRGI